MSAPAVLNPAGPPPTIAICTGCTFERIKIYRQPLHLDDPTACCYEL
jgi:hypothetical protein